MVGPPKDHQTFRFGCTVGGLVIDLIRITTIGGLRIRAPYYRIRRYSIVAT
ncbi:MAG: hypothetical protein ACI8XZ_004985 [Gammaproteobacteria bacterium]|jgi:hypothetical protein